MSSNNENDKPNEETSENIYIKEELTDADLDAKLDVKPNEETNDKEENSYSFEKWDELDIESNLLRGIYAYGFENPSPIQKQAIKPIMANKDLIAQAQSGTGKTGAFTIGALNLLDVDLKKTQILIINPTYELLVRSVTYIYI